MIEAAPPKNWHDLQKTVAQILGECGFEVEVDRPTVTVRGAVNIDVFALDRNATPEIICFCECKNWKRAVPKNVVHAFRTVVSDGGASLGIIISSAGFQSGAFEAAAHSNIHLVSWDDFQRMFEDRWFQKHMAPTLNAESGPLVEYTEPINSRIFRKADALPPINRERFKELREKHFLLALGLMPMFSPPTIRIDPPIRDIYGQFPATIGSLPDDVLDAPALRPLMEMLIRHYRYATAEFDEIFGERA